MTFSEQDPLILDNEEDNQFEDPGVEYAPTKPTLQAPQLPPSISDSVGGASRGRGQSTATSSNIRRCNLNHMTPGMVHAWVNHFVTL